MSRGIFVVDDQRLAGHFVRLLGLVLALAEAMQERILEMRER